MSTQIIADDEDGSGFYVTRYYGGKGQDSRYQITEPNGQFVDLSETQMQMLIEKVAPLLPKPVRP